MFFNQRLFLTIAWEISVIKNIRNNAQFNLENTRDTFLKIETLY